MENEKEVKSTEVEKDINKMSPSEIQAELSAAALAKSRLDMKKAKLEILEKEANLEDLQERLADRKLKRASREAVYRGHGANLLQDRLKKTATQNNCNHRKGGDGARGVIGGEGTDQQYAVLKHRMANGDIWVRCLRCAKTWKPPVKSMFKKEEAYDKAMEVYNVALQFPTRNHTSSSQQFEWGYNDKKEGGKEFYREQMKSVNLE